MQRYLVAKISHDVVPVSPETDDDSCTAEDAVRVLATRFSIVAARCLTGSKLAPRPRRLRAAVRLAILGKWLRMAR